MKGLQFLRYSSFVICFSDKEKVIKILMHHEFSCFEGFHSWYFEYSKVFRDNKRYSLSKVVRELESCSHIILKHLSSYMLVVIVVALSVFSYRKSWSFPYIMEKYWPEEYKLGFFIKRFFSLNNSIHLCYTHFCMYPYVSLQVPFISWVLIKTSEFGKKYI